MGFGVFVLILLLLEYNEAGTNPIVENFSWVWGESWGVTLILVGLEILSLNAKNVREDPQNQAGTSINRHEPNPVIACPCPCIAKNDSIDTLDLGSRHCLI